MMTTQNSGIIMQSVAAAPVRFAAAVEADAPMVGVSAKPTTMTRKVIIRFPIAPALLGACPLGDAFSDIFLTSFSFLITKRDHELSFYSPRIYQVGVGVLGSYLEIFWRVIHS